MGKRIGKTGAPVLLALSCACQSFAFIPHSALHNPLAPSCNHPRVLLIEAGAAQISDDAAAAGEGSAPVIEVPDRRPHEQRTAGHRKARRLNHVFQHLYRHDDPAHYSAYENAAAIEGLSAREYLVQHGGYTNEEVEEMGLAFPPLLELDVMRHLWPKMRFLKHTLGGVSHSANAEKARTGGETMTSLSDLGRSVPPTFFGARLERTVAPRHAFLMHLGLPHGQRLLEDGGKLCKEFLVASRRTKSFCALCNAWMRSFEITDSPNGDPSCNGKSQIEGVASPVTPEQVEAFESLFHRGLMSAARNDMESVDALQAYAKCAKVTSRDMVKVLAHHGANPLEKDVRGISLVHWAAGAGNLDALEELVRALPGGMGEAINMTADRDGASPLHWAAAGAKSKEFGCGGNIAACRFFLNQSKETKKFVNVLTKDGNSVLMWAAWSRTLDVVKLLVRNRADTTVRNRNGCSVAHWAASGGDLSVCRYLHEMAGVDFTTPNSAGNTPLSHAVAYGRVEVVQWLRDEVLAEDSDGRAVDLAWDFVTWADGDTEREKVFNLFQDDPNSSSDPFGE